jgi:hypothetical protein
LQVSSNRNYDFAIVFIRFILVFCRITFLLVAVLANSIQSVPSGSIEEEENTLPVSSALFGEPSLQEYISCMNDALRFSGAKDDVTDVSSFLNPGNLYEKLKNKSKVADFICNHGGLYVWGFGALIILLCLIFSCCCCFRCCRC